MKKSILSLFFTWIFIAAFAQNNVSDIPTLHPQTGLTDGNGNSIMVLFVAENGQGDGGSWQSATNLADALRWAYFYEYSNPNYFQQFGLLKIYIKEGVHKPKYSANATSNHVLQSLSSNQLPNSTFRMVRDVELIGGFKGYEMSFRDRAGHPAQTILSGDHRNNDRRFDFSMTHSDMVDNGIASRDDNSYRLITVEGQMRTAGIQDVTITGGGNENASGDIRDGAGMYIKNASFFVANCIFRDNYADRDGGAVFIRDVSGNSNEQVFVGSVFHHNFSWECGPAIFAHQYSNVSVFGSTVAENSSYWDNTSRGGAIHLFEPTAKLLMSSSIIAENFNRNTRNSAVTKVGISAYNPSYFQNSQVRIEHSHLDANTAGQFSNQSQNIFNTSAGMLIEFEPKNLNERSYLDYQLTHVSPGKNNGYWVTYVNKSYSSRVYRSVTNGLFPAGSGKLGAVTTFQFPMNPVQPNVNLGPSTVYVGDADYSINEITSDGFQISAVTSSSNAVTTSKAGSQFRLKYAQIGEATVKAVLDAPAYNVPPFEKSQTVRVLPAKPIIRTHNLVAGEEEGDPVLITVNLEQTLPTYSYRWYVTLPGKSETIIPGAYALDYAGFIGGAGLVKWRLRVTNTVNGFSSYEDVLFQTNARAMPLSISTIYDFYTRRGSFTSETVVVGSSYEDQVTYQWYSNTSYSNTGGTPISGATNKTHRIPANESGIKYYYAVATRTKNTVSRSLASNPFRAVILEPTEDLVLYVDQNVNQSGAYKGAGNSWEDAVPDLAIALQWAGVYSNYGGRQWGDGNPLKIFIAKGVYKPIYPSLYFHGPATSRSAMFSISDYIALYGGFDPSGGIRTLDDQRIAPPATMEGVRAGNGTVLSGDVDGNDQVTISNGAVQITGNSENNLQVISVGAHGVSINGVTVTGGNANYASQNQYLGGGIYATSGSNLEVNNSVFFGNSASDGGAIAVTNAVSSRITNSVFLGNRADNGGAIYLSTTNDVVLSNLTLALNTAVQRGGAVYRNHYSKGDLHNSILVDNVSLNFPEYGNLNWMDSPNHHNLIQGNGHATEDLFKAPLKTATTSFAQLDYSLKAHPATVNAGNNAMQFGDFDVLGNSRLRGGKVDIGAYESPYRDVRSVEALTLEFDVGTPWSEVLQKIQEIAKVEVVFGDDSENQIAFNTDFNAWSLAAESLPFDESKPGTYRYEIPLTIPALTHPNWFTNTQDLRVNLHVVLKSVLPIPEIKLNWNGVEVDPATGLDLIYGDEGSFTIDHDNTDRDVPVQWQTVSGDAVLDLSDPNEVLAMAAGTGWIRVSLSETENFAAVDLQFEVRVGRKELTVTPESDQYKLYDQLDPVMRFSITGWVDEQDEALLSGALTREAGEAVGNYGLLLGDLDAGTNYRMSFISGVTFEIRPGRIDDLLDLTFEDASFVYDGTEKSIEVAMNGVLPTGFSIQYQNHTRTDAGHQDVQAVISGPNYEPLELTARLTIEKATPSLSATWDGSMIDADALFELTYGDLASILTSHTNTDQDVSVDVLLVSGDGVADMSDLLALRAIVAGTARIALMLPESANYKEVQLEFRVQVHPKLITVIAESKTKVFAELDPVFTYSFSPALVVGDEFDGALSREAGEDVGAYPIELGTLDLGPNYELVLQSADLIITPADIRDLDGFDLDFADATFVFTGQPHTIQVSGALPAGASVSYTDNSRTDVGSQTAEARITGSNYQPLELTAELTVTPANIRDLDGFDLDFADATFVYTGQLHTIQISGTLPAGASVSYTDNSRTDVGSQTATALISGSNYQPLELTAELTVTPADIRDLDGFDLDFADASFVYTGQPHSIEITGTLPAGASVSYTDNSRTDVGVQTAEARVTGSNYQPLELTAALTVTPADIRDLDGFDLDFADGTFVFTGQPHSLEITGTLPAGASVSYTDNSRTNVGSQTATAFITGSNYQPLELAAELTVTPADIRDLDGFDLDFADGTFVFTGQPHAVQISGTLPAGASVSYTNNSRTDVGVQTAEARITGSNYQPLELTAELTVTPADIRDLDGFDLDFADASFVYTGQPHTIQIAGTLPAGASVSYTNNRRTDVGSQTATAQITGSNYQPLELTAALTVTPADIRDLDGFDLDFADGTFVYTGQPHSIEITGTLPAGASVSYTDNSRSDAGSQVATALITLKNHHPLELQAMLHVSPGTRTIAFPEWTQKTFGDADFDPMAKSSSGETIQYSSSDEQVAIITESGQIRILGAGTATITATVPENSNYENKPVERRTLVVAKAKQVISLSGPSEVNRNVGAIALDVRSSSALSVDLTVDDSLIATLDGHDLRIHRLGTLRITATQPGNENYEPAEPVSLTIRVLENDTENPADSDKIKGIRVHQAVSPNGDGINDFLIIEGIRDYPENRLTIFNRNGVIVYEAPGYNNGSIVFRGQGKNQQQLPAGTYYYLLDVRIDGVWKQEKGFIVLRY